MPTTKYTITILNGLLQGIQLYKFSSYEVNNTIEYLEQMGYVVSVQEKSLI
jgi:hypothetical protein